MSSAEHRKLLDDLRRFENDIPNIVTEMGAIAQSHFVQSFRNQGFTDRNLQRWQPRKRTRRGDAGRAILVGRGSGNLRRLRRRKAGRYSVDILSNPVTDSYANVHNEGLRSGRGRGFKMPKRQFVGYSAVMNDKIIKMINRHVRRTISAAA